MVKDEILKLKSGKELDGHIAELMGWNWAETDSGLEGLFPPQDYLIYGLRPLLIFDDFGYMAGMPNWSGDISLAMEVVEYLREKGCGFQLKMDNIIWAEFYGLGLGYFTCTGETLSEAICKSALLVASTKDMWYEK